MTHDQDRDIDRLEHEAALREAISREREKSDTLYALKLVEKIVFGFMALLAVAVMGALLNLVVK